MDASIYKPSKRNLRVLMMILLGIFLCGVLQVFSRVTWKYLDLKFDQQVTTEARSLRRLPPYPSRREITDSVTGSYKAATERHMDALNLKKYMLAYGTMFLQFVVLYLVACRIARQQC
jgi:hypothetical protein